ncbi:MAG: hypothetical protein V3G42_03230 [Oscillospiraceae bacterium]
MKQKIEIRIRDRVGVVNEITGTFSRLNVPLYQHEARISRDIKGTKISVFRGQIETTETESELLRKKLSGIKGFLSLSIK